MIDQEGVLSRWSRRKLRSKQESIDEESSIDQQRNQSQMEIDSAVQPMADQETSNQPVLTDEDMPEIDTLHEESDFSAFMSPGVSDELRNLALKKLFRSQIFNVCDGLDEYDEDYTSFESLGDIVTCDMKHQLEMEARKKMEQEADQDSPDETSPEASVTAAKELSPADHTHDAQLTNAGVDDTSLRIDPKPETTLPTSEPKHEPTT